MPSIEYIGLSKNQQKSPALYGFLSKIEGLSLPGLLGEDEDQWPVSEVVMDSAKTTYLQDQR